MATTIDAAMLLAAFQRSNFDFGGDNELANEAVSLCSRFSKNPNQLADEYDALIMTKKLQNADTLNKALLERLRTELTKKEKKQTRTATKGAHPMKSMHAVPRVNEKTKFAPAPIPMQPMKTPSPTQKRPLDANGGLSTYESTPKTARMNVQNRGRINVVSSYNTRPDKGKILRDKYNEKLLLTSDDMPVYSDSRCQIEVLSSLGKPYPCMYTPLSVRGEQLENILNEATDKLAQQHKITNFTPVGEPSEETVYVVGRICCEADGSGNGTMNDKSVWLEGSRMHSNGKRIALTLDHLSQFSLFPGQIVAAKGICANGRMMNVERLFALSAEGKMAKTSPSKLLDYNHGQSHLGGKPLQIMVAAGPYCVVDDLEYTPLNDLFIQAGQRAPDVLVLLGPFVDENNVKIELGDVSMGEDHFSFKDLFQMQVVSQLDIFLAANPTTKVIIAPSPDDAHHMPMYPQPAFDMASLFFEMTDNTQRMERQVTLLPNPGMVKINEIVFAITTSDIVMHMLGDDTTRVGPGKRKGLPFSRLPAHLWNNSSFYPMFPPNRSACVDLAQSGHFKMEMKPDVLICSSKLNPAAVEVEKVLVCNPGRLCKGGSGGTFARMCLHPYPEVKIHEATANEEDSLVHDVSQRLGIEFVKI